MKAPILTVPGAIQAPDGSETFIIGASEPTSLWNNVINEYLAAHNK
jgi:hypothetical protein